MFKLKEKNIFRFCTLGIFLVFASLLLRAPAANAASHTVIVKMSDQLMFQPVHITIHRGETVEWKNTSVLVHTVTDKPELATNPKDAALPKGAKGFNSGNLAPNKIYRHTFTIPGHYRYFCIPHEAVGMVGDVRVLP
jgi:plastocyanin